MSRVDDDTKIGGVGEKFPETRISVVRPGGGEEGSEVKDYTRLLELYWKPVYKYIRIKWGASNEEAKDLTQGFFSRALEKDFFSGFDPARARFRTFLRVCLDRYIQNESKASKAQKRGGEIVHLDFSAADSEIPSTPDPSFSPDRMFEAEWTRQIFSLALERLSSKCTLEGKELHFKLFQTYELDGGRESVTYTSLAAAFHISESDVTNYLAWARREFRLIVLQILRETTSSQEEFRQEFDALAGRKGG